MRRCIHRNNDLHAKRWLQLPQVRSRRHLLVAEHSALLRGWFLGRPWIQSQCGPDRNLRKRTVRRYRYQDLTGSTTEIELKALAKAGAFFSPDVRPSAVEARPSEESFTTWPHSRDSKPNGYAYAGIAKTTWKM